MPDLFTFFYGASLLLQILAAVVALDLYVHSSQYRWGWLLLALGLVALTFRRALMLWTLDGHQSVTGVEALIFYMIASAHFLGIVLIRNVVISLELANRELKRISQTDSLTGAFSRAETFGRARLEISRSQRHHFPLSFVIVDIDHFKRVNDDYGHEAGDLVLQGLVKTCQVQLRKIDTLGRVGGEEFMLVLPETNEDQAHEVCDRLRTAIERKEFFLPSDEVIHITISLGIATYCPQQMRVDDESALVHLLCQHADAAMYQAKKAGRNQVAIWH